MQLSKHERIMNYLYSLEEGAKISVRQISSHLDVSDGTSYRAIKQAEKEGLVKTIPRVGSIRVTKREIEDIKQLSFEQIQQMIDGKVISGDRLLESVGRIIIGAMEIDALTSYLEAGALLIIGNREDAQRAAILNNTGMLITGGFGMSEEILSEARARNLPVISTPFDTFTVASIIHKEIYSLSLSNEMVRAVDFVIKENSYVLDLSKSSYLSYIPSDKITILVDKTAYLGTVKSSDLHVVTPSNYQNFLLEDIELLPNTTLQRMRQLMTWEQLNILPVVDAGTLLGVVHRRDVFKEMVPRRLFGDHLNDNVIERHIDLSDNKLAVQVMPLMTDEFGSLTESSFMSLVEKLVRTVLQSRKIYSYHIDSYHVTQMKVVQLYQEIQLTGEILDIGHQFLRLEVVTSNERTIFSKALLQVQIYEHK